MQLTNFCICGKDVGEETAKFTYSGRCLWVYGFATHYGADAIALQSVREGATGKIGVPSLSPQRSPIG